jgi:hypothetical protein
VVETKLDQIKKILKTVDIPKDLDISPYGHIFDLPRFIDSHISVLEANPGNKAFMPYYQRLMLVVRKLKQ